MRNFVLLLMLLLSAATAQASTLYTFTGANGLSGSFVLDETTPILITVDAQGNAIGLHQAPGNMITATLGQDTFTGPATLNISDAVASTFNTEDSWIVRSSRLNLFIFRPAGLTTPMSLSVPSHTVTPFTFSYTWVFPDQTFIGAPLETLNEVPESASVFYLGVGLAMLREVWRYKVNRRHLKLQNCFHRTGVLLM